MYYSADTLTTFLLPHLPFCQSLLEVANCYTTLSGVLGHQILA